MDPELCDVERPSINSRPYRSHVQPACYPCRARKSRCQTGSTTRSCAMCQTYGTDCIYPQAPEQRQRGQGGRSRRNTPSSVRRATATSTPSNIRHTPTSTHIQLSRTRCPSSASPTLNHRVLQSYTTPRSEYARTDEATEHAIPPVGHQDDQVSALRDIIAKSGQGSSMVVSPAIADDDRVFQEYLSNSPSDQNRRMVRFHLNLDNANGHPRPLLFNIVPKRGQRETESRSLAASYCEVIEKIIEPYQDDLINLFFEKINICFPIFDEMLFRKVFVSHKESISPSLLSNLYGNTLTYWNTSPRLSNASCPDQRSVWIQSENALNAELKTTPGISTILTIILNITGRPSTHHLGNGASMGMGVALAYAFGLNRDPSEWNLSLSEKRFRMRIWWLLVIYDSWCSLAYGTPPLISRTQHDVPNLTVEDISNPGARPDQIFAASCFVALTTLSEVLSHCLEHVYHLGKGISKPETSLFDLENLLTNWEDSLHDSLRRLVIRGTQLVGPGAANLRLAYLSVKLLIRRIHLDWDKISLQINDVDSQHYIHARRVSEEIVDFVRELDEAHLGDFWIPPNAFSLTSATTFLMRNALNVRGLVRSSPLKLARIMIDALQSHRDNYDWDIADNCLSNCSDLLEKIEAACDESSSNGSELQFPMPVDMDFTALHSLFPAFANSF